MDKPDIVRAWCEQRVGCPYIYGATGKPCTPAYREARMKQYPAYAAKIKRNCPRLSGTASACENCAWCDPETGTGKLAYDCAQLSRWAMAAVGISLVSGASSQWERTDWASRGKLDDLPMDRVCLVFRMDTDHMGHVGIYQGDGTVIHAKGHDYGVVREMLFDTKFTHWGIPMGLYEEGEGMIHPILRQGDTGTDVAYLQTMLSDVVEPIQADGVFGPKTANAVRVFQASAGLTVDGVVGPKTWAALESAVKHDEDISVPNKPEEPAPEQPDEDAPIIPAPDDGGEYVMIPKRLWDAIKASAVVLHEAVRDAEAVG